MPKPIEEYRQQTQCNEDWCWAAIAASVIAHSDGDNTPTQCDIAQLVLPECGKRKDCKGNCQRYVECRPLDPQTFMLDDAATPRVFSAPPDCMPRPSFPKKVLTKLSEEYGVHYVESTAVPMSVEKIKEQVRNDWPVVIERYDGRSGLHLLVVVDVKGKRMRIVDPLGYCKEGVHQKKLFFDEGNGRTKGPYTWKATYHHRD